MELSQIREEIDQVDAQIVKLIEKRMELSGEVAESKRGTGKAIYDRQRELEKLDRLGKLAGSEFNRHSIEELFLQIMSISRRYQYKILGDREHVLSDQYQCVDSLKITPETRVVYQGVPGAFSEMALLYYFGEAVQMSHVEQFEDVVKCLAEEQAEYGVLPIENSSAGFVNGVYHLLEEYDVSIVGGVNLTVSQALLGVPGASLSDIKTVYSHPQAIMQTKPYLEEHDWHIVSMANTAVSAKKVQEDQDKSQAAVASVRAAKLYGLDILQENINLQKHNTTRFVVISKNKVYTKDADQIALSFSLPHESGTLYNTLGHFIFNDLNMTSIESEAIIDKQWEYRFFITFEGNLSDQKVINALTGIKSETVDFKILGNYKNQA